MEHAVVDDKKLVLVEYSDAVSPQPRPSFAPDIDRSCGTTGTSVDGHRSGDDPTTSVEPIPVTPVALLDSPLMLNSGEPVAYDARRELRMDLSGTP